MPNKIYKYNNFLILIFSVAPIIGFITESFLDMSFNRIMQLFSYFGVILLLISRNSRYPIKFPKYLFFYLLFIIYVFYSDLIRLNRKFDYMYLFSNYLIGGFNMLFIIENTPISNSTFKKMIKISLPILVIAFLIILIQQTVDESFFLHPDYMNLVDVGDDSKNRLHSIYSWVGRLTVGFGFVPIYLIIVEIDEKKRKNIFIWIIIGLIFAILSKARWIMLNTFLVFIIIFLNHRNKFIQFLKLSLILPLFLFSSFFLLNSLGIDSKKIIEQRILESDKNMSEKSAGTRILALKALNEFYWDHPLFGIGNIKYGMGGTGMQDYKLRSFLKGRSSQIHVGYASLLYMYGFVGAVFFLSFLFLLLKKLYKDAKFTSYWAPFLGILGFVLSNFTMVSFVVFEMGLIIAMVADKYYVQQKKLNRKISV